VPSVFPWHALPPKQTNQQANFAALIAEVSGIEAKLGEAMQVIADIDAAQTSWANAGDIGDSE
jgi:hypothetical protein